MSDLNAQFASYIKEDSDFATQTGHPKVGPLDGVISADDSEFAAYELHKPEYLERVNAFLAALTQRPYINPYAACGHLKTKLAIAGLDFEAPTFTGLMGKSSMPVFQWGHPTPFEIEFGWVCVKGWYTLSAQILPSMIRPANPIAEKQEKKSDDESLEEAQSAPRGYFPSKNSNYRSGKKTHQKGTAIAANLRKNHYTLKTTLGDGSRVYTHTQGHSVHIHAAAMHGSTFSTYDPKGSLMGHGTSVAALRQHLATVHGRINDHKHSKGGFKNVS